MSLFLSFSILSLIFFLSLLSLFHSFYFSLLSFSSGIFSPLKECLPSVILISPPAELTTTAGMDDDDDYFFFSLSFFFLFLDSPVSNRSLLFFPLSYCHISFLLHVFSLSLILLASFHFFFQSPCSFFSSFVLLSLLPLLPIHVTIFHS